MKKTTTLLLTLLVTVSILAQSPQKMSYQAVIRDASNTLVTNTVVGMQISILQTTSTGTAVYVETQTPTTNANGLVSIEIGGGTVVSGTFSPIDWSAGHYFIKTETDPAGGATYTITGTSQLLSVPYALYAESATETDPIFNASASKNITTTNITNWNNKQDMIIAGSGIKISANTISTILSNHYIGEVYGGGVIFYLYLGDDGLQHGLIVNDSETSGQWQSPSTFNSATRSWDGAYNSSKMTNSLIVLGVNSINDGGFTDWYIPSIDELILLWNNRFLVNKTLFLKGYSILSSTAIYWSSTELDTTYSFAFSALNNNTIMKDKSNSTRVWAIRAF